MPGDGPANPDRGLVTITLRRSHLSLAVMLVVGFALGYASSVLRVGRTGSTDVRHAGAGFAALSAAPIRVDISGRPAKGSAQAPVTLVEFTDYQCPYCARHFRDTHEELLKANAGKVRYVVRHYPVASLHHDAQKAAEAAECAFDQGRFWEYHAALFERSPRLSRDSLGRIALEVGLDTAKFVRCLDSGSKAAIVQRDLDDGRRYGVIGTPTFFINGRVLIGAQPIAAFQAEIDRASLQR